MIVVYPMLVSQAVSENAIPAIAKTLEQYIIIHLNDEVVSSPEVKRNFNFKIEKGKFIVKESEYLAEVEGGESGFGGQTKSKEEKQAEEDARRKREEERREAEHRRKEEEHEARMDRERRDREAWDKEEERRKDKHQAMMDKDARDRAKAARDIDKENQEKIEKAKEEAKQKEIQAAKRAKAEVKMGDNKALSIEPTYMTVTVEDVFGNTRKEFLGIKVVPFRVKSDAKLSRLIMHDSQMKTMQAGMVALGRKVMRFAYSLFDRWTKRARVLGGLTPSGDPRRDIIFDRTGMKGQGFVVLSKTEDIDDTFLSNINRINRLFKLGWGNFIIADDINRQAYFCMKKFRGICTAISYKMMYQNFGMAKVYDDLEDAKRQSSSLFRIKKRFSKVVSEWVTDYRYTKYISEEFHDGKPR